MSRILLSCETSFAHFSTNKCGTIDAILGGFGVEFSCSGTGTLRVTGAHGGSHRAVAVFTS